MQHFISNIALERPVRFRELLCNPWELFAQSPIFGAVLKVQIRNISQCLQGHRLAVHKSTSAGLPYLPTFDILYGFHFMLLFTV